MVNLAQENVNASGLYRRFLDVNTEGVDRRPRQFVNRLGQSRESEEAMRRLQRLGVSRLGLNRARNTANQANIRQAGALDALQRRAFGQDLLSERLANRQRQALGAAIASQQASQRGGFNPAAARAAQQALAGGQADIAQQAQLAGIQEQRGALADYLQGVTAARQQSLQGVGLEGQLLQGERGFMTDKEKLALIQQQMGMADIAEQDASGERFRNFLQNRYLSILGLGTGTGGAQAQADAASASAAGSAIGAGAGLLGLLALSDINAKANVADANAQTGNFLDALSQNPNYTVPIPNLPAMSPAEQMSVQQGLQMEQQQKAAEQQRGMQMIGLAGQLGSSLGTAVGYSDERTKMPPMEITASRANSPVQQMPPMVIEGKRPAPVTPPVNPFEGQPFGGDMRPDMVFTPEESVMPPQGAGPPQEEAVNQAVQAQDMDEFLESLNPIQFDYKNPAMGQGTRTGVSANDIAATKLGSGMVIPDQQGLLRLDTQPAKFNPLVLGALGNLNNRLRAVEGR